jgi:enoyl-CoA hydratase
MTTFARSSWTGSGERAFAAGADIGELTQLESATQGRILALRSHELGRKMADLPKPIIAVINGFALGGGLELALACDVRLASDTAQVGLPEVTLGIIPGWGGTQRLPRVVGPSMAKLLMMTGERIDAQEALRIGLVERVHPQAELLDAAKQLATKLAGLPPLSIAAIKQAVNRGLNMALDDANMYEASLFAEMTVTQDCKEGTRAFLEKRKPEWQGR